MAKIFISYSNKDSALLPLLTDELNKYGHELVYDKVLLSVGDQWHATLSKALKESDGVIFILTENSLNSKYVMKEWGAAESMAADNKKFLIPVVSGKPRLPDFITNTQVIGLEDPNLIQKINQVIYIFSSDDLNNENLKRISREMAATQPPVRSKRTATPKQYWFLKVNPDTWNIFDFAKGYEAFFNTHDLQTRRRIDYEQFAKVKPGDLVIGYAFGSKKTIECIFEVAKGIHSETRLGEGILMHISEVIDPPIPLELFSEQISFREKLVNEAPERLFPITKKLFDKLRRTVDAPISDSNAYVEHFTTEGNHRSITDQLSFTADIESLGTVICLKKVEPPLAIGLFAKWGAGKSFFMEKLNDYIKELASYNEERYVKNVIQVKFNSWHYSDANLWASLITEIFEALDNYATGQGKGNEIEKLSSTLQITSQHKAEAETRKKELQSQLSVLKAKQQEKRDRLEDISGLKLLKLAATDPKIVEQLKELDNKGIENIVENKGKIDDYIKEVKSVSSRFKQYYNQLKNTKGLRWWWVFILAFIIFTTVYLIKSKFSVKWDESTFTVSLWLSTALSVITKLLETVRPYLRSVKETLDKLNSLKNTIQARAVKEDPELDKKQQELLELSSSLEQIDTRLTATQKQIDDISSGRKLMEFIDKRARDENYSRQLGMIAWIRKDFQALDRLLREQHEAASSRRGEISNPQGVTLQIDRIVLYIDDLDRCNEEIVVRVLEAIHLLLAFPLFVVVVGVDPRWLNNALNKKYDQLFSGTENNKSSHAITSYDYLEKIFQIPFALKETSKSDRERLLQYLTKDELQKISTEPPIPQIQSLKDTVTPSPKKVAPDKAIAQTLIENEEPLINKVSFSADEITYMKTISGLFGHTPRTINRFVNIYRIIKSHRSYQVSQTPTGRDFKPTMFVLAIILGYPEYAQNFLEYLQTSTETDMLRIIEQMKDGELKKAITTSANKHAVDGLTITMVKRNIELISRFSFRTHDVVAN